MSSGEICCCHVIFLNSLYHVSIKSDGSRWRFVFRPRPYSPVKQRACCSCTRPSAAFFVRAICHASLPRDINPEFRISRVVVSLRFEMTRCRTHLKGEQGEGGASCMVAKSVGLTVSMSDWVMSKRKPPSEYELQLPSHIGRRAATHPRTLENLAKPSWKKKLRRCPYACWHFNG